MIRSFFYVCAMILLSVMLSACLSGPPKKSVETLNATAKNYGKFIRWRSYDGAADFLRRRDGQPVNKDIEPYKEIRVTKYQITTVNFNQEQTEAVVTAEISYYHERVNNVKTISDNQVWWRDENSGSWFLEGELPPLEP